MPALTFTEAISCAIMIALGLNTPKSFTLLGISLILGLWNFRKNINSIKSNVIVKTSVSLLVFFGISFSIRQFQAGYWPLDQQRSWFNMITFTCYPSACLIVGYLARKHSIKRQALSIALVCFAIGGLCYVLLSIIISHDASFALDQIFKASITIPWGEHGAVQENVRSVEQRAFPGIVLLMMLPSLLRLKPINWPKISISFFILGSLSIYSAWALGGRLYYVLIASLCLLNIFNLKSQPLRLIVLVIMAIIAYFLHASYPQMFCDERISLQLNFLKHIQDSVWGGRNVSFVFKNCFGSNIFFGPPPSQIHLPHNIGLDTINDAGLIPAAFLLAASLLLIAALASAFFRSIKHFGIDWQNLLRIGIVAVVFIQSAFQPFMYSDRLFFITSYLITGAILAESNDSYS